MFYAFYRIVDDLAWHYEDRAPRLASAVCGWLERRGFFELPDPRSPDATRMERAWRYIWWCAAQQEDPDRAVMIIERDLYGDFSA